MYESLLSLGEDLALTFGSLWLIASGAGAYLLYHASSNTPM